MAIALSLGSGWIAVATNKQMLRVFSLGGMQHDVISIPGVIVGVAGWGSRLAIIYQEAPCKGTMNLLNVCLHYLPPPPPPLSLPLSPLSQGTENVFQLKVWVLDVKKRKQLSPPHSLPLSLHSKLEWFGYVQYMYMYEPSLQEMLRKARQQQQHNRKTKQHNTTCPKQLVFKEKLAASGGT